MFAQIEALVAFADAGTMTAAATRLRLTQPAISKRIAQLELDLGRTLVERSGRNVHLTPAGHAVLREVRPLLAQLKAALAAPVEGARGRIAIGVSDSLLASWGAELIRAASDELPVDLEINAHRSPAAIDHVRGGEYGMALVAGQADIAPDLEVIPFAEEPMIVVPAKLDRTSFPKRGPIRLFTIEEHSATWRSVKRRIADHPWRTRIEITQRVQSFVALAQLARAGFGHALIPWGVARALHLRQQDVVVPPRPLLQRPISIVGRPGRLRQETMAEFCQRLTRAAQKWFDSGDLSPPRS